MSDWELIDHNPATGLNKYIRTGDEPDTVEVRYEQTAASIQQIIDRNKELANHHSDGRMGDLTKAAEIPIGVMYEWKKRYNVDAWAAAYDPDQAKAVRRLLNDPDWRYLKCRNIII